MASCIMRSSVPAFSDFRLIEELMSPSPATDCWPSFMGNSNNANSSSSALYPERFGVASDQMATSTSRELAMDDHNNNSSSRIMKLSSQPLLIPCKIEQEVFPAAASPSSSGAFKQQQLLMNKDQQGEPQGAKRHYGAAFGDEQQQQQQDGGEMFGKCHNKQDSPICSSPSKAEPDHEVHIWTERERRKKMRSMFVTLHSMLPKVPSKADKSTIVDEAISYIKLLELKMQKLLKKKADQAAKTSKALGYENAAAAAAAAAGVGADLFSVAPHRPSDCFQTLSSSKVVFNLCGSEAFINICSSNSRPNLLSTIFGCLMEHHRLEVKNVQITNAADDRRRRLFTIHVANRDLEELKAVIRDLMQCV